MKKRLERLKYFFETIFGGDEYDAEDKSTVRQNPVRKEGCEKKTFVQDNDKPDNIIIASLRKVFDNFFDNATAEPISIKEWTIALSVIFSLIFGGIFLRHHFDIKGNAPEKSIFKHDSVLVQISQNRYQSLKMLTDHYTNMHLDDAVTGEYNEANEIMKSLKPAESDYFVLSAKSYYSAGIVFAGATYVPSFFSMFNDSAGNNYTRSNDFAVPVQNLAILSIWDERSRHLSSLKNHYRQFTEAYEQNKEQDYIILCTKLKLDFIKALDFYNRLLIHQLNDAYFVNLQMKAYQICESIIGDTDTDILSRSLSLTAFMDKLHFNALSTLYVQYGKEAGHLSEPSFLRSSAEKMDRILNFDKSTTKKEVLGKLVESSAMLLTVTDSTMTRLDKALSSSGRD